jgi:nitrate/TMAO reductase-like tetraheme cytochrome c subunit
MKGSLERWIKLLIVVNVILVASLALGLFFDMWNWPSGHPVQAGLVSSSASPDLMAMGLAHIPTSNNCILCHDANGSVGLKIVPAILHPIEGWRRCVACHTNETLGRNAPGHEGIAEEECLNCHKVAQGGPAITQPHAVLHDQKCLDCHGGVAHLPSSMASTKESDCILCHKPTTLPPPAYPHAADAPVSCRTCHQSPEVGGLPIDHALRADSTCLMCHDIKQDGASPSVPLLLPSPSLLPPVTPLTPTPTGVLPSP